MQTTFQLRPVNQPNKTRKRVMLLIAVSLLLLLITAVSLLASPMGRRLQANQRAMTPAVGVTGIEIIGDTTLNHVFSPAVTQINAGDTVTWSFNEVDEDGVPVEHNVVFDDSASPVQATGTYSLTFSEPGTYNYTCTLHAYMDGAIVVTE